LAGDIPGHGPDPAGERPEEVRQEFVLVVDVREVALAREDVEGRHDVVLAVAAEPGICVASGGRYVRPSFAKQPDGEGVCGRFSRPRSLEREQCSQRTTQ